MLRARRAAVWVSDGAGARRPTGSKARRRAWLRRAGALAHRWPQTETGRVLPAPAAGPHPRLSPPATARRAPTRSSQPCFRSRASSSRRAPRVGGNGQRALGVFSATWVRVPVGSGAAALEDAVGVALGRVGPVPGARGGQGAGGQGEASAGSPRASGRGGGGRRPR